MNDKWILREILRIAVIENERDKKSQQDKLDEVIEKNNELKWLEHERQYRMLQHDIKNRGIDICESPISGQQLRQKWKKIFLGSLNLKEQKAIHINQFLWHCFSYQKIECLSKGEAKKAFANHKKNEVFVFYQHKDEAYVFKNTSKLRASDFDMDDDVYVVDKNFKWTYVKTHESMCGPYFARAFGSV